MTPPLPNPTETAADRLHLSPKHRRFLDLHGIAVSDAYIGMLRAYHGDHRTIWQTRAEWFIALSPDDIGATLTQLAAENREHLLAWIDELMGLADDDLATRLAANLSLFE